MKPGKLNNILRSYSVLLLIIIGLTVGLFIPLYSQTTEVCPSTKCPGSCIAIEGSTCTCLPTGCDVPFTSSSSGNIPFCKEGKVTCKEGNPVCNGGITKGDVPICGSRFGLVGDLAGAGCTTNMSTTERNEGLFLFFNRGAGSCASDAAPLSTDTIKCTRTNLCRKKDKHKESCRGDKTLCKCVCPFKNLNEPVKPKCSIDNVAICSDITKPVCSKAQNVAGCNSKKMFCLNKDSGIIDLTDNVTCVSK